MPVLYIKHDLFMKLKIFTVIFLSAFCHGMKYQNIINMHYKDNLTVLPISRIIEFTYSDFSCLHARIDGSSFSYSVVGEIYKMKRWTTMVGLDFRSDYCYGKIFVAERLPTAKLLLGGLRMDYDNRILIIVNGDHDKLYFNDFTNVGKAGQILGHSEGLLASLGTNYTYHIRRQPFIVLEYLETLDGVWKIGTTGVTNFQGRELNVGASNCSFFSEIAPIGPYGILDWTGGFDKELLKDILRRLNLTYKLVPPPTGKVFGLLEEGDANGGIMRLTASGSIDLVSCGLTMTPLTNSMLDVTFPMIEVCYKLLVPRPRIRSALWNIFRMFQPSVWALIVSMVFAGALGLMYAARCQLNSFPGFNYERCWLEIVALLLGTGTKTVRKKGLRIILMWWMILNVALSAGYSSLSIGFLMRSIRDEKIESISDLIANDFRWISTYRVAVNRILDPETEPKTEEWAKRQVVIQPSEIKNLLSTRKYVILGNELQIRRLFLETVEPNEELGKYEAASDCLSRCFLTVGFAKGSPFKKPIWKYLGRNNNGGLNKKIVDRILYGLSLSNQYVYRIYESDEPILKSTPEILTMKRVKGAFLVWIIGMAIALVVFIIEVKTMARVFGNSVIEKRKNVKLTS